MAPLRSDEQVGRVLDSRYRLTRLLGTGTSAHVYVADDVRLRRRVAVKVLHPALAADQAFLRRFRAEAEVVAALRHPNIGRVFDWGTDGDAAFLVLELLEGGTLRSLLDSGYLLTPAQVLRLGIEAGGALDHAHRRGLVHRDVKPANLIFDDESRVTVADFGLARALAESTWTEPVGTVVGTARYAAPEQVRGGTLDARADVYALALVLVEAATGRVPFATDTTFATLMARVDRPLRVGADLGPLTAILEAAGTVDPADRLDAAGLVAALTRLVDRVAPPTALPLVSVGARHAAERDDAPTEVPAMTTLADSGRVDGGAASLETADAGSPNVDEPSPPPAPASDQPRPRRRRLVAVIAAAVVVVGGAIVAVVATRPPPTHPVPSIAGDTQAAALAALRPLHLGLRVGGHAYDATAQSGTILTQRPATGRLAEGSKVTVVISAGPRPVPVPVLAGKSQADATAALTALGLKVGTVTPASSTTVSSGSVITSTPDQGTLLPGQAVALQVSTGPPTVPVPTLSGSSAASFAAAKAAITALGLLASENDEYSNSVPAGQVISTYPAAGFAAPTGSTIVINVSKGPQLITVPTLSGQSVAAASATLAADGFSVSGVSGNPTATVTGTSPAAGAQVRVGTAVQLTT